MIMKHLDLISIVCKLHLAGYLPLAVGFFFVDSVMDILSLAEYLRKTRPAYRADHP